MDVVTLGAALSIMKKMPDTAASSAAAAEDAADRAEAAARTLTIDDTLSKPGQPADSKAVGDVLAEKLDIADLPDTVSNANQLLSEKYVVDTEPYHLRPSGGNGADREFDTIVGGSVVWNQLVGESDSSVTVTSGHKYIAKISGSYSVAVSDGTAVAVMGGTDEVFDITQMFGSTIADYIYSLEQATTGAGVAWFRKYFPNDYYGYNPGELMHVSGVSAHKTYDADESVIGNYPLDSNLTLRGIPKLVNGKLSFDGDIYKPDGTVERRYGIVDLGTLNWTISESTGNHFSILPNGKPNNNTQKANARCSKYTVTEGINLSSVDYSFAVMNGGNGVGVHDKDLSGIAVADFKAAMSGVYIVYELATPTTEEAEPYHSPQILDPYGTEEYVTTSLVPVGHETKYPENLRAKIEGLPWNFASLIAPVEVEFKATRNYTSGSLFIVDNVLYKATANIANGGTITPNTNCTATTLAEIIAAL